MIVVQIPVPVSESPTFRGGGSGRLVAWAGTDHDPAVTTWTAALALPVAKRRRAPRTVNGVPRGYTMSAATCIHRPKGDPDCDDVCPRHRPNLYAETGAKHRSDR